MRIRVVGAWQGPSPLRKTKALLRPLLSVSVNFRHRGKSCATKPHRDFGRLVKPDSFAGKRITVQQSHFALIGIMAMRGKQADQRGIEFASQFLDGWFATEDDEIVFGIIGRRQSEFVGSKDAKRAEGTEINRR